MRAAGWGWEGPKATAVGLPLHNVASFTPSCYGFPSAEGKKKSPVSVKGSLNARDPEGQLLCPFAPYKMTFSKGADVKAG